METIKIILAWLDWAVFGTINWISNLLTFPPDGPVVYEDPLLHAAFYVLVSIAMGTLAIYLRRLPQFQPKILSLHPNHRLLHFQDQLLDKQLEDSIQNHHQLPN